jgi:hypothetical protein
MNHIKPKLKVSSLFVAVAIATVTTATNGLFMIPNNNDGNATAQPYFFAQPLKVHIDKTDHVLDNYGVIIRNIDYGNHVEELYTDSISSPSNVIISGSLSVHDGDRLIVCVMKMSTKQTACDMESAHYNQVATEFFVDMNNVKVFQQNNTNDGGDGTSNGQSTGGTSSNGKLDQYNSNQPSSNAIGGNNNGSFRHTYLHNTRNTNTIYNNNNIHFSFYFSYY